MPIKGLHKHKKGEYYLVLGAVKNATNGAGYTTMVRYLAINDELVSPEYVRELSEFYEFVTWPDGHARPRFCPVWHKVNAAGEIVEEIHLP